MDLWYRLRDAAGKEAAALSAGDHEAWDEAREEVECLIAEIGATGEAPPPDIALEDIVSPLKSARQDAAARSVRLLLLLRRGAAARSRRAPVFFDNRV